MKKKDKKNFENKRRIFTLQSSEERRKKNVDCYLPGTGK